MTLKWNDLTQQQQQALDLVARGRHLMLTTEIDRDLKGLALVEQKLGGTGLSRLGIQLYLSRRRRK